MTTSSVFAPIALLMPYETVEEAIELANGTRYGLGASVFGPRSVFLLRTLVDHSTNIECIVKASVLRSQNVWNAEWSPSTTLLSSMWVIDLRVW